MFRWALNVRCAWLTTDRRGGKNGDPGNEVAAVCIQYLLALNYMPIGTREVHAGGTEQIGLDFTKGRRSNKI